MKSRYFCSVQEGNIFKAFAHRIHLLSGKHPHSCHKEYIEVSPDLQLSHEFAGFDRSKLLLRMH